MPLNQSNFNKIEISTSWPSNVTVHSTTTFPVTNFQIPFSFPVTSFQTHTITRKFANIWVSFFKKLSRIKDLWHSNQWPMLVNILKDSFWWQGPFKEEYLIEEKEQTSIKTHQQVTPMVVKLLHCTFLFDSWRVLIWRMSGSFILSDISVAHVIIILIVANYR